MAGYYLTGCSTADLTEQVFHDRGIPYACFHFELGGVDYLDDLGKSVPPAELFRRMAEGASTRTSQITVGEYEAFFEPLLKEGKDILHITLSSGISGTYNSACIAQKDLAERYPDRKLYIVDSLGASSGYGLLLEMLADRRDAGMGIDELRDWAEANKLRVQHWFFSTDLTYYIRGGRVSKVAGFMGQLLNICPLLNVNSEGKLIPREKIRGKRAVTRRIVEKMVENAENGADYDGKVLISHSLCMKEALAVAGGVERAFPRTKGKIQIYDIGATIGSHTGPGTVALFFVGKEREL